VIALGLTERVIDARRDHGGLIGATSFVATQTDIHRLAAVALGIALVFCAYFVLTDIATLLGSGTLTAFFFKARD
jgi:hypothetical protein